MTFEFRSMLKSDQILNTINSSLKEIITRMLNIDPRKKLTAKKILCVIETDCGDIKKE